jgi:hypothetical protein
MDRADIQRLADLVGLDLQPAECDGLAADLARLDAWVDALPRLAEDALPELGSGPPGESVPPCPLGDFPEQGSLLDVPSPGAGSAPETGP